MHAHYTRDFIGFSHDMLMSLDCVILGPVSDTRSRSNFVRLQSFPAFVIYVLITSYAKSLKYWHFNNKLASNRLVLLPQNVSRKENRYKSRNAGT